MRHILFAFALASSALVGAKAATAPAGVTGREDFTTDYTAFRARFVRTEGRVADDANGGASHSEGQGYGMLFAVAADDRKTFDALWAWTKSNLRTRGDALFAWRLRPEHNAPDDSNNATDGDLLIAWALLRADGRWHVPAYAAEADAILADVATKLVVKRGGRTLLLPGEKGFVSPAGVTVNLSYWLFPAFKAFERRTAEPWKTLTDSGRALMREARFGDARLPTDWILVGDTVTPAPGRPRVFGHDAVRIPLLTLWADPADAAADAILAHWDGASFRAAPTVVVPVGDDDVARHAPKPGLVRLMNAAGALRRRSDWRPLPGGRGADAYYSAALGLLARLAVMENPPVKRPPDIVFFITDDQYRDMMNFTPAGRDTSGRARNLTPATDALAREGTVMENLFVVSPVCTPSRFSCMTGLYPSRSRAAAFLKSMRANAGSSVVEWNTFVRTEDADTLPKLLKRAGYFTGIVGKNHVVETSGLATPPWKGDPRDPVVKALLAGNAARVAEACRAAGFDFADGLYDDNPTFTGMEALNAHNQDWVTRAALDCVDAAGDRPLFLWMASTLTHGPTEPARSWKADRRITPAGMLDSPPDVQPDAASLAARVRAAGLRPSPVANASSARTQPENSLWLDDALAALVEKLRAAGRLDNTIIVYFNDHGQTAKGTLYEGGLRTDGFIWRKGGWPAGASLAKTIQNTDFAPTILDLAGVAHADVRFDGVSFAPDLSGARGPVHDHLYFELGYARAVVKDGFKYLALRYPPPVAAMSREERESRLKKFNARQLRTGRPVYTTDPGAPFSHVSAIPGGGDAEHGSFERTAAYHDADQLYDLKADPGETRNLTGSPEADVRLRDLREVLKRDLSGLPGTFGARSESCRIITDFPKCDRF